MVARNDILTEELTTDQSIQLERVWQVFENARSDDNSPYLPPGERMRQPREAVDIDAVPALIKQIFENKQELDGVVENAKILFTEERPDLDITTEAITFSLVSREPGSISKGAQFNRGVQEWKPHIRSIEEDIRFPGQHLVVMGQKFDNEMLFTCWAKTNKVVNARARWLEDTLRDYAWFMKFSGVEQFYFLGQGSDIMLELEGKANHLMGRSLRYFVRTERITTLKEQAIRRMIVKYGIGHTIVQD
jgi:hypothetical protein